MSTAMKPEREFDPKAWYKNPDLALLCAQKIEGQFYERKSKRHPEKLAETICAFATSNPQGGLLTVGISDDGQIEGLRHRPDVNVNEFCDYRPYTGTPSQSKLVDCTNKDGKRDQILLIYVPYLENRVAETSKGKAFIRQGDKTIELRDSERRELEYSKGQISFEDEIACEFSRELLSDDIIAEFRQGVVRKDGASTDVPFEQMLLSKGLLKKDGDKFHLTKAAILLLGKDPCLYFPGAYIRFLRYSGTEKKTGQEQNLVKDEFFKEPLPRLIIRLKDFLKTQLRDFTFLGGDGKFVTEPEYPEPALLEAIVNAVVHRSYSQMNMFIRIEMYDDRIEIQSPGDYPAGVHPTREFIHHARNHRLMDGMRYLGFVQMLSEGSLRMKQDMERANLPAPEFSMPGNPYVRVILRNDIERRRIKQQTGESAVNEFTNFFRITWTLEKEQEAGGSQQPPTRTEIGKVLLDAFRAQGYTVDSFAQDTALRAQDEQPIPELQQSGLASIYAGFHFRLASYSHGMYLTIDHNIEVKNRATLERIFSLAPEMKSRAFSRGFVRIEKHWQPCEIIEIKQDGTVSVSLLPDETEKLTVAANHVLPKIPTTWIAELLRKANVNLDIHSTVKRLAFNLSNTAARQRASKTEEIAKHISEVVFPLHVRGYKLVLEPAPQQMIVPAFTLKSDLVDVQPVFSKESNQRANKILNGLSTYGSYEKPSRELPLVLLCTPDTEVQMRALVDRLRQGSQNFRGMEKTFALSFGDVTGALANSPADYLSKCHQICASVSANSMFLVYCPEKGYSRADYKAPYYQVKHFLLEAGFASQMVDEDTIANPSWKDYNLALDVFAKAGHVPWVLSEGLPNADLFLGLSYSSISGAGPNSRLIGYVNVFDRYGKWLFYRGNTKPVRFEVRNKAFRDLLADVAKEYTQWAKLQRVHVHHKFKLSQQARTEIANGVKSVAPNAEVSFVYVNEHSMVRLYDKKADGDGSLRRGSYVLTAPNRFFIATTGQNDFGQRGMGTPRPLDVSVNRISANGELDMKFYAQHLLSLTRLNWASTKDFCREPITLKFASDIAYLMNVFLASFGSFTLNSRLERTPWFL